MQSGKRGRTEDWDDEDLPRLSKSRACTECKKHKIKCERTPGEAACERCRKQGHNCVISNKLQKLIEDDSDWKRSAKAQISQLQGAVADLLRVAALPQLSRYGDGPLPRQPSQSIAFNGPSPTEQPTAMTRENSQDPDSDPELVSAPMKNLYEVTKLRNLRSNVENNPERRKSMMEDDFVSRGVLPLVEAEQLFNFFNTTMNHFLWGGIALVHSDLKSVRKSSSLLLAAILTVSALHIPDRNEIFNTCYTEFITIVSNSTLNRYHTLDEIRGLCIGAFWLSDLSWKLSGSAARLATEINLHMALPKMMRGKANEFEKAQLFLLLYVCDHHFSIAYGRPPVIHESTIANYQVLLESPQAKDGDIRMTIQVSLFIILAEVYRAFGTDMDVRLAEQDFALLRAFNLKVEEWRLVNQPRSADSAFVGTYPSKGVVLYYHFAKFQINSLSLRAISANETLSMERKEAATAAVASAMAILNTILYEADIRNALVGIPLFTHAMVAFSAVFLLKVAWKWRSSFLNIDSSHVQSLVQKVIDLMSSVAANEKHLTYHIANGLAKMLERLRQWSTNQAAGNPANWNGNMIGLDPGMIGPSPSLYDTLDNYGLEFDDTWNDYSNNLDFFSNSFQSGL